LNYDISTSLSVLGIVLTVLFFVVGYRQTIGARKERARAANSQVVDVLFRPLAHEEAFGLSADELAKLLDGWALQAKVRFSDILGASEVEALLVARVFENDYISDEQRKSILERVRRMFQGEAENAIVSDDGGSGSRERADSFFLAAASGSAALATSLALAATVLDETRALPPLFVIDPPLTPAIVAVVLTTFAIAIFSYVRDTSRSTRLDGLSPPGDLDVERAVQRILWSRVASVQRAPSPSLDFIFKEQGISYGVEVKRDINRLGRPRTRLLAARLAKAAEEFGLSKVYILSAVAPLAELAELQTDKLQLMSVQRFMRHLQGRDGFDPADLE